MNEEEIQRQQALPENVVPIRSNMEDEFRYNAPILNAIEIERMYSKRYEMGLCRDCSRPRGHFTPFCQFCYPHDAGWEERP